MEKIYHLAEMPVKQRERYGEDTCLLVKNRERKQWDKISWITLERQCTRTAQALIEYGVGVQEYIGVYSENMDKFIYTDLAAFSVRAVSVPLYATSSPAQVSFIVRDASIRLLFVGGQLQYNNAYKVLREENPLEQLIVFDSAVRLHPEDTTTLYYEDFLRLGNTMPAQTEVKVRRSKALLSDTACLIYTSGTMGDSKGVVLTHRNITEALKGHVEMIPNMTHRHTSMNFLPLTHVFEKMWCFLCLQRGVKIAVGENPKEILTNLAEIRPHFMCNVPRFWEKVYLGVQEKIQSFSPRMRKMTIEAIEIGRRYHFDYIDKGIEPPLSLKLKYKMYEKTLFSLVKKNVGIDRGRLFPTAGAALADPINQFLQSIGIPIVIGYGLTETTATVCFCRPEGHLFGSIGTAMPGVDIRIDPESGEIQVKGETVTKGYYNKPEVNAELFTPDGWLRTGDSGYIDEQGNVFFRERLKDLYKTANGKYIAPQMIEGLLTTSRHIEQVMVVAEERPFVSALIYPNWDAVCKTLAERDVPVLEISELARHPEVMTLMEGQVEEAQKDLATYEKVKKFVLLTEPFSIENGLLTSSLKIKRKVVAEHYAQEIDSIY